MKSKTTLYILLLHLCSCFLFAQIEQYNFKQQLDGISSEWHKVILPNSIFSKIAADFSDIRIFGITVNKDTIEVPYILKLDKGETTSDPLTFKIINKTRRANLHFFTFELSANKSINKILLDFEQQNFQWQIKLEGSQDQKEWYTILEDYRILSIKNEFTNYQYTNVNFPNSKYRFLRLVVDSDEKPILTGVKLALKTTTAGTYRNYPVKYLSSAEDKKNKQTIIDLHLESAVPISRLKFDISENFDFYRRLTVQYLADSFETQKGWKYNYRTLTSGTLSSIEENEFEFSSITAQKFKIIIYNHDNAPLAINSIEAKGFLHTLIARFPEPANFFLVYGNKSVKRPVYDIARFSAKIPLNIQSLLLGDIHTIEHHEFPGPDPLFENMTWLWLIMILIIFVLGWFSLKMINKNSASQ